MFTLIMEEQEWGQANIEYSQRWAPTGGKSELCGKRNRTFNTFVLMIVFMSKLSQVTETNYSGLED